MKKNLVFKNKVGSILKNINPPNSPPNDLLQKALFLVLQQKKTTKKQVFFSGLFSPLLWNWRDSNPRPNKELLSFLHAYSAIDFRWQKGHRHPKLPLSFC